MKKINLIKDKLFLKYSKNNLILIKMIKNWFKLYRKVKYNCHYTGKHRVAAHNIYNLRYKIQNCSFRLHYISIEDNKLMCKCTGCKKNYKWHFDRHLIAKFANPYKFYNKDVNKFIFILRKGIYPYEYMDSGKRFDEKPMPKKEYVYSSLNMEEITDIDYRHARKT